MDYEVGRSMTALTDAGFTGDNWFMAGHSLGGAMTQNYIVSDHEKAKMMHGAVLMGSVLTRSKRSLQSDGLSNFDVDIPVLSIGGTRDGLMRVTRVAESFWHQYENINADQDGKFPVSVIAGLSHAQFASGANTDFVKNHDLQPAISDAEANQKVAAEIVRFMEAVLHGEGMMPNYETKSEMYPFIKMMEMEGSNWMKPPCNDGSVSATCLTGSQWME